MSSSARARAFTLPVLPLFVYGTLRSGERAAHMLDADVVRRAPARVNGCLVDTGEGVIQGELVWVRAATYASTLERLDAYEGAPTLFRRIMVVAETGGERLEAFAYDWLGRMG